MTKLIISEYSLGSNCAWPWQK